MSKKMESELKAMQSRAHSGAREEGKPTGKATCAEAAEAAVAKAAASKAAKAARPDNYWVILTKEKRLYISLDGLTTFGDLKTRIKPEIGNIPNKFQKLIHKGKDRENDAETLASAQVKKGTKMRLLFREGYHTEQYGSDVLQDVVAMIEKCEGIVKSVGAKLNGRTVDSAEASLSLSQIVSEVDILRRNLDSISIEHDLEMQAKGVQAKERLLVLEKQVIKLKKRHLHVKY